MVEMDTLAEKMRALLSGNGLEFKMFDNDGNEVTDPSMGRRFFITSPNVMITIDEENNNIEFNKGADIDIDSIKRVLNGVKRLATEFQMDSSFKVFGKSIQPRDFSYQAKKQKEPTIMENKTKPINHQLLGEVFHLVKRFKSATAHYLADNMHSTIEISDIQPVLNRLVQTGKLAAQPNAHGEMEYTVAVDEAVMEMQKHAKVTGKKYKDETEQYKGGKNYDELAAREMADKLFKGKKKPEPVSEMDKTLTSYKTKAAADAKAADAKGNYKHADKRFSGIIKATKKQFKNDEIASKAKQAGKDSAAYKKANAPVSETVKESFSKMFGSSKTSQQTLENVRILVRHKVPVSEEVRGSRTRHISSIFLECNGERMRFQHNYLPGARAMAQHMAHGGSMGDKVGSYINESTGNLLKLQSFNRYVTTNKLINEDSSGIVETVKENIETLRSELKKLTGVKTYETAKARLETFEREALAEDDTSGLKDLFTIRRFDEKFEEVLPIVKQLVQEKNTFHKRIEEAAGNVVMLRREAISTTPMFEFAGENARLGFKISELALRIMENDELAGFINKIGTKLCKEGAVNNFEKAVLTQVFENSKVAETSTKAKIEIKESMDLEAFYNRFDYNFM